MVYPVLAGRGAKFPGRRLTIVQYLLHTFYKVCNCVQAFQGGSRGARDLLLGTVDANLQALRVLSVQKLTGIPASCLSAQLWAR